MFDRKKHPRYSIFQNVVYMLKAAFHIRKSVLLLCALSVILTVGSSLAELLTVPKILRRVEEHATMSELFQTIIFFVLVLAFFHGLQTHVRGNTVFGQTEVRMGIMYRVVKKAATTSYPNMKNPTYDEMLTQSGSAFVDNTAAAQTIWNTLSSFLSNLLGFIVYLFLFADIHLWIVLLISVTAMIEYLVHNYLNEWHFQHRKEGAACTRRMNYSCRVSLREEYGRDIRVFGMEQWLRDVYQRALSAYEAFLMRGQKMYFWGNVADVILLLVRNGAAYLVLIRLAIAGTISVSEFLLYFSAMTGMANWVSGLLQGISNLKQESVALNNMREWLDIPEEFLFEEGEALNFSENEEIEIELRHVSFRYPNAKKDALSDVSLTLHPGERLALVGLNGAGKTTLIYLICGLYNPTQGVVLINGRDIRSYNRREYYRLFSAVFQQYDIYPTTIADNVSQEPDCDEERVKDCLVKADLWEKVEKNPKGIYGHIGKKIYDDGIQFSGGETQKLILARALYKNGPILILDEPSAALDPLAEEKMYQKYHSVTKGKSSIYISHRLASTRFCDRIIMLSDGKIVEEGTHDELLTRGGWYADMYRMQSKYYKEEVAEL